MPIVPCQPQRVIVSAPGRPGPQGPPGPGGSQQLIEVVSGGTADVSATVQQRLDELGDDAGVVLVRERDGATIRLDATISIRHSRVHLRFDSPLVFGAAGRVRIMGDEVEVPETNKPHLAEDAPAGSTTLVLDDLDDVALFTAGDLVVIRGERDANQQALFKQEVALTAVDVSTGTLTLAAPLEETYLRQYPNGRYSEVTRIVATTLTQDAARGDRMVHVADTSGYAVGEVVRLLDQATTADEYHTAPTNWIHRETAVVREVDSVAGTLRLSHGLYHGYAVADGARVVKLACPTGSSIQDAHITWSEPGTGNALELINAVSSWIARCTVSGETGHSWERQGIRLQDALHCWVEGCMVRGPVLTGSGQGYGITVYGATLSEVRGCHLVACRHSIIVFNGAAGNVITGNVSEDCALSDIDLHGGNSTDTVIRGNHIVGGDTTTTGGGNDKAAIRLGNTTHTVGDHRALVEGNTVTGYSGSAFHVLPRCSGTIIRGNRVQGAVTGLRIRPNGKLIGGSPVYAGLVLDGLTFTGNELHEISDWPIDIDGETHSIARGLLLLGNRLHGGGRHIQVRHAQRVQVRGNVLIDPAPLAGQTVYAVTCENITGPAGVAVVGNELAGAARGIKVTGCPGARIVGNDCAGLTDGTLLEDGGGNTGLYVARNDHTGTTGGTLYRVSGTGPSPGRQLHRWPEDHVTLTRPSDQGLKGWSVDPATTGGNGGNLDSGEVYLVRVHLEPDVTSVERVYIGIGTAGAGLTAAYLGLYTPDGTLLAATADQSAEWQGSTGSKYADLLGGPVAVTGPHIWVGILAVGTTPPELRGAGSGSVANSGQGASDLTRYARGPIGQTTLPASVTLLDASNAPSPYWAAVR